MGSNGLRDTIRELRTRYASASKAERLSILDHHCSVFSIHRRHAIRLLTRSTSAPHRHVGRPRKYDREEILPPLVAIWKASNLICGKRLAAILPLWVPRYRDTHGHSLPKAIQAQLCTISPAMIDRLLAPYRPGALKLGFATTRPGTLLRKQIPIRTNQWDETRPGFLEADTVAHCGTSLQGMFVFTVAVVDLLNDLHRHEWTLFQNFFLPGFKLIDKQRHGGKILKVHDAPKIPCQRLLIHPAIPRAKKKEPTALRDSLDPFVLQRTIQKKINAILRLTTPMR